MPAGSRTPVCPAPTCRPLEAALLNPSTNWSRNWAGRAAAFSFADSGGGGGGGADHRAKWARRVDEARSGTGHLRLDIEHRDCLEWRERHAEPKTRNEQAGQQAPSGGINGRELRERATATQRTDQ